MSAVAIYGAHLAWCASNLMWVSVVCTTLYFIVKWNRGKW